jgi:hypothetical protein
MVKEPIIHATKEDNLDSIIEKILSQKNNESKLGVYSLFFITHSHYITGVNVFLKIKDPELWKIIRKSYYPTLLDKINFFLRNKIINFFRNNRYILIILILLTIQVSFYYHQNLQITELQNQIILLENTGLKSSNGIIDDSNYRLDESRYKLDESRYKLEDTNYKLEEIENNISNTNNDLQYEIDVLNSKITDLEFRISDIE